MVALEELELLHSHICLAVGDPRRIQILYALHEKPSNVSTLTESLGVPQPTVSRHLAVLRQRALVKAERDGMSVIYSLTDPRIIEIIDLMRQLLRDAMERQTSVLD